MPVIGVPRLTAGTIDRPRLIASFESPAAVVTALAPAGYGKTVAVAQWALSTESTGLWIRVRGRRVESAAFVQDLADELLAAGLARQDGPLRHLREEIGAGTDPWELLRRSLRDGFADFVLVIDDVDRLAESAVDALIGLVEDLPRLRLRATARSHLRLTEPGLRLLVDAEVVGADRLALTELEARGLLGSRATPARVDDLLASGGLPLLARAMAEADDGGDSRTGSAGSALATVLSRRIVNEEWESRFVDFLVRTSVADELTVELAAALSRDEESGRMLDRAEREGLGLWSASPARGRLFRFAPPVREAFELRLRADHPTEIRDLVLATARWEAGHGVHFRALERARQFEDWGLATAVVREGWPVLLSNHARQVRELFASVSVLTMRKLPLISMMLAIIYNARGVSRLRALEFFALANFGAGRQASLSGPADRALLAGVQAAALRVSGRIQPALVAAERAVDVLASLRPDDRERLGPNEPTLYNQAGTTFFYGGRTEQALEAFARSTAVGDTRGLTAGLLGLGMTAGVQAVSGDISEARVTAAEAALRDWPEGWLTGYSGSFYQIARAFIALEEFDLDEADRRVRILDPHRETIEHWSLLTHLDVVIGLLRGTPAASLLALQNTVRTQARRHSASSFVTDRMRHTFVLAHLANDDAVAAERSLGAGNGDRHAVSSARIALARGLPDDALRMLQGQSVSYRSSRSRAESQLVATAALALLGDDERTRQAADAAVTFLEDRQQMLAVAFVPRPALSALVEALHRVGATATAERLRPVIEHAFIRGALPGIRLSPREAEVARRLATHEAVAEIAASLSVSPNTVKTQLRSLYRKLGATSRQEALARLALLGITDSDPHADRGHDRPAPE